MKALPAELEAKIDEIHSWMFDNDLDRVAKISRKSKTWVCQVLNKKGSPNKEILEAAIEVMNENKSRFECQPRVMKIA